MNNHNFFSTKIASRRGFACVALDQPKFDENVGSVLRAAGVFEVALVALNTDRLKGGGRDTMRAYRHVPVVCGQDVLAALPVDCVAVAVELQEDAIHLPNYVHPERAFYVFGGEDRTLDKRICERCRDKIIIPTRISLNLAACVNVVLYDRAAKRNEWPTRLKGGHRPRPSSPTAKNEIITVS